MKLDSLDDLYLDELKDLYSAEKQLIAALPQMARAASSPEVQSALQDHLQVTQEQVRRLEHILREMSASPDGKQCLGMQGLIQEGQEIIKIEGDATVKDTSLVSAAQKVEHYEIAGYAAARTHAEMLGYDQAVDLLEQTLEEEAEADTRLGDLAEKMDGVLVPDYEGEIVSVHFWDDGDELDEMDDPDETDDLDLGEDQAA